MQQRGGILEQHGVDVLIREIDDRVEVRHHADQLLAHLLHGGADRAHHLRGRILRSLSGAGGDQIVHRLGLGQAQLAV